jgi:hypothetical protein
MLILLPLLLVLGMVPESTQLQSSQTWSLLEIQQLLNYPPVLHTWGNTITTSTSATRGLQDRLRLHRVLRRQRDAAPHHGAWRRRALDA